MLRLSSSANATLQLETVFRGRPFLWIRSSLWEQPRSRTCCPCWPQPRLRAASGTTGGETIFKADGRVAHLESTVAAPINLGFVARLGRYAGLFYALTAYVLAIGFWPVFIFFIGNVPRIEMPLMDPSVSAGTTILPTSQALAIDVALIAAFALHHSFLARPAVKRVWGRFIAEPFRRATFTQIANVFAFAIVIFWQPIPIVMWQFDHHSALLRLLIVPLWQLGWILLLLGAMSFKLTALFGLRQVWFWFKGKPYEPVDVTSSAGYKLARHPEFLGVFLLIWVTADMTVGHFLLASTFTIYSFLALHIRERAAQEVRRPAKDLPGRGSDAGPAVGARHCHRAVAGDLRYRSGAHAGTASQ